MKYLLLALSAGLCAGCLQGGIIRLAGRDADRIPAARELDPPANVMPREWLVVGPFELDPDADPEKALDADFLAPAGGGEAFDPDEAGRVWSKDDTTRMQRTERAGDVVDLDRALGGSGERVGYAVTDVTVPEETVVCLMFAATGPNRAWVNGRPVFRTPNRNGSFDKRDGIFTVRLRPGTNRFLLQVGSGPRGWRFSLTPADPFQPWLYRRSDYRRGFLSLSLAASEDENGLRSVQATPPRWLETDPVGPAEVLVWDQAGREVIREHFDLDAGFPLRLSEAGLYRVRVFQTFADNSERIGTLWVKEGDLADRIRSVQERADRWLAASGRGDRRQRGRLLWLLETAVAGDPEHGKPLVADAFEFVHLERLLDELEADEDALGARRGGFLWGFVPGSDGSGQPLAISLPDDFDPDTAYPLVVFVHGSGAGWTRDAFRSGPADEGYIQIAGDWRGGFSARSYHGLAERDILDAIDFMQEQFRIDPARITLFGHSYGGFAAWRMGALYPDRFAALASHAGLPEGHPLSNLIHVPIRSYHGLEDLGVCPVFAYYGAREVRRAGGQADVVADPDAGHWVFGAHGDAVRWLLGHRADPLPRTVDFTTRWVARERGRAYWTEVLEMNDPHRAARLRLTAESGRLAGTTDNIAHLKLRSLHSLFDETRPLDIAINDHRLRLPAPLPDRVALRFDSDASFSLGSADDASPQEPVYSAGSLQNLFDGRPVRVVVPSGGSPEYRAAVTRGAKRLAQTRQRYGGLPVISDRDIDPEKPDAHLIVLGTPETNACMRRLLDLLPLDDSGEQLDLPVLGSYPLAGRGYAFHYYHPDQPQFRIVLYRSAEPDYFRNLFAVLPDGRYRPNMGPTLDAGPDFALFDVADRRFLRVAHLDQDWTFPASYADSPRIDPRLSERRELYGRVGEALRAMAGTDYAFTPYDVEPRVDPDTMRAADLASLARAVWGLGIVDAITVEFDNETMRFVADRMHREDLVGRAFDPYALWPWPDSPWPREEGRYTVAVATSRFQDFGTATRMRWASGPDLLDGVRTVSGDTMSEFLQRIIAPDESSQERSTRGR